jgi:hypothetical protein
MKSDHIERFFGQVVFTYMVQVFIMTKRHVEIVEATMRSIDAVFRIPINGRVGV